MTAGQRNIIIDQGADQIIYLQCRSDDGAASDLSGYTAVACYVGASVNDPAAVEIDASFIDSGNAESETGDETGIVRLEFAVEDTRTLGWSSGRYQVWLTAPSGARFPIIEGQITLRHQVPVDAA